MMTANTVKNSKGGYASTTRHYCTCTSTLKIKQEKNSTSMVNAIWALFAGTEPQDNSTSQAKYIKTLMMHPQENLS